MMGATPTPTLASSRVEDPIDALGRASRRAAALSLAGFLLVLGALGYGFVALRQLERQTADLQTRSARLRGELANEVRQRDSLVAIVTQTRRALASTRAAINAFHEGRLEDAVRLYDEALDADPDNAYVRNLQAYALFRLHRMPEAMAAQRKSLAADSTYAWGYFDLARFLCATNRDSLSAARAAADRAIALRPDMRQIMRSDGEFQRVCGGRLP